MLHRFQKRFLRALHLKIRKRQQIFPRIQLLLLLKAPETAKMLDSCVSEVTGAVRIKLHVHPGAKRNGISGFFGDSIKFDLQTPPVDGKANAALIKQFSKMLKCSKSAVQLISGECSRDKVLEIRDMDKSNTIILLNDHIL